MPEQFDQSQYFKSLNPNTGATDIFQNVQGGQPKYIDEMTGKGLFAQGLNADLIGSKPYPVAGVGGGSGTFNLDIPNVIDVAGLKDAFSTGITKDDITKFTEDLKTREADYVKTLTPTDREKGLMGELAGVVSGVEKAGSDLGARAGIDFFTLERGKSELQRQNELTVANLQRNIQIEQTNRGQASEAAKFLVESAKTGFDTLTKGYDSIFNRATALMNVVGQLNTQSQNAFNSVMTNLGGLTWDQLDSATKARLTTLAGNLGIPEGVLKQGLQVQADKMKHDREAVLFQQDIQKQQLDIQRANANKDSGLGSNGFSSGAGGEKDAVYDDAFNYVAGFLTADQRKFAGTSYAKIAKTGDKQAAREFLEGLVLNAVPTEQFNQVTGRFQAIAALEDIEKGLAEYKAAGGNTGIIRGSLEDIANKLGKTTDPKVAGISNDIRLAIQAYRKSISGAAFTEAETKEYEAVFPSVGRGSELNEAKMQSLRSAFNRNNRVIVERLVGPGNYQKIWGEPVKSQVSDEQLQKDFDSFMKGDSGTKPSFNLNPTPSPTSNSSFSFF